MIAFPKPAKKEKVKKPLRKMGKGSLTKSKKKAWTAFSLYIRLRFASDEGYATCVTCGVRKHYKELQAGHFIPGRHNAVLFSEEGVQNQCYHCNVGLKGNWPQYYDYMKKMYGLEVVEKLLADSQIPVKYTARDYEALENKYKQLIEEL